MKQNIFDITGELVLAPQAEKLLSKSLGVLTAGSHFPGFGLDDDDRPLASFRSDTNQR